MEQRVQSSTSTLCQHQTGYLAPHESFRGNTYDHSGPQSFDERMTFQNSDRNPSIHRTQVTPMDLVDLVDIWSFEAPACDSPISTSSSISNAESIHTPPSTGLPMYETLEPTFPHTQSSLANNGTCTSGSESLWPCSYPEVPPWDSQSFVLPCQNAPTYEQPTFELTQSFQAQAQVAASAPYLPYSEALQYPMEQTMGAVALKTEESGRNEGDSDDLSDSDSDESEYEDSGSSSVSANALSRRSQARSNVFRVEGWSTNMCAFNATPDRKHVCQVLVGPNGDIPCPKRFQRPEHLRRHIKTVHRIGLDKINYCKVPGCRAPFPRSDNFRQHYLTHLTKGKRRGNNEKMSFQRMKEILGPREKQLLRWLRMKLRQS